MVLKLKLGICSLWNNLKQSLQQQSNLHWDELFIGLLIACQAFKFLEFIHGKLLFKKILDNICFTLQIYAGSSFMDASQQKDLLKATATRQMTK